ncbi:hypothetical protein CIG75_20480 [Tumebacillus algifaecis]|uniref:GAF domain-containing protein n=1 Tax=Tumebacillus algifaecis TaxID=1214604 RepID=A0A223D6H7_9BACL|nr:GAF domain-containing protein [Tumebacillus algifaecis]ASS77043.1 hypothetical protein CIG75_20480 [Tumebacillus algifaecis]
MAGRNAIQAKPEQKLSKSIARQISSFLALFIALILAGGALLFGINHAMQVEFEEQVSRLDTKAFLANEIQQSLSNLMIEYRGFVAYQVPVFKGRIQENQRGLQEGMARFRTLALTEMDQEHLRFMEDAANRYSERVAEGVKLIDAGRLEEITRRAGEEGFLTFSDELRERHETFTEGVSVEQMALRAKYARKVDQHTIYFAEYLTLIALVIGLLAVRFARDVGGPLRTLALFSEHYEDVKIINLPYDKRGDEIGYLTRSMKKIFMRIKENERLLVMQHEELQFQQDEMMAQKEQLIWQQDELHHARKMMREQDQTLAAQQELNLVLQSTLDREEALFSIIHNVVRIVQADKGAIILLEDKYPHAVVGLSELDRGQLIGSLETFLLPRVREAGQVLVIEREAEAAAKDDHEGKRQVHDLILPLRSHDGEVMALILLTRIERRFGSDAVKRSDALSNQIALSIEKLRIDRVVAQARQLSQTIIDSLDVGVLLFDEQGELVQVNQIWYQWMGDSLCKRDEELTTERLYEQITARVQQPDELIRFLQAARAGLLERDARLVYELQSADSTQTMQVWFVKIDGATLCLHRVVGELVDCPGNERGGRT